MCTALSKDIIERGTLVPFSFLIELNLNRNVQSQNPKLYFVYKIEYNSTQTDKQAQSTCSASKLRLCSLQPNNPSIQRTILVAQTIVTRANSVQRISGFSFSSPGLLKVLINRSRLSFLRRTGFKRTSTINKGLTEFSGATPVCLDQNKTKKNIKIDSKRADGQQGGRSNRITKLFYSNLCAPRSQFSACVRLMRRLLLSKKTQGIIQMDTNLFSLKYLVQ